MTMKTAKEVDAIAADWAARIDGGSLTPDEERALVLWMDSDIRNRGAFMRMRAIALHTERAQALGTAFDPNKFLREDFNLRGAAPVAPVSMEEPVDRPDDLETEPESPRRSGLATYRFALKSKPAIAAAAAACAIVVVALQLVRGGVDYDTRQGEVRVVPLDDGSVMTLNTASHVKVSFEKRMRKIRLIEGEALFDVAKDKSRPFVVAVGDASVRAIGTSFTVRRLADNPAQILVREGVVEVRQSTPAAPLRLSANMQAEVPVDSHDAVLNPKIMQPDAINRELAWRDGRIAFEAETLDQAVAAFARYSQIHIVIDDPAVAREQITGLFTANDPVSFAKAAATSLGLTVEVRAGEVRLSR